MTHRRQTIRAAMATALTGLAATGSRVYASRLYPLHADELPALRIFTPTDSVDGDTIVNPAGAATDNRLAAIHDVLGGADTTDKRGNYIRGFAQGIRHNPGGIESHNAFEDVTTPVTNRQTSATITPNAADIVGAQAVNSQYRPLPGSALLRAGSHVGYRRDLEGRQRQNPPSIGAYDGALFSAYRAP